MLSISPQLIAGAPIPFARILPSQTAEMIKHSSKKPDIRRQDIQTQRQIASYENSDRLGAWGVEISAQMENVPARVSPLRRVLPSMIKDAGLITTRPLFSGARRAKHRLPYPVPQAAGRPRRGVEHARSPTPPTGNVAQVVGRPHVRWSIPSPESGSVYPTTRRLLQRHGSVTDRDMRCTHDAPDADCLLIPFPSLSGMDIPFIPSARSGGHDLLNSLTEAGKEAYYAVRA